MQDRLVNPTTNMPMPQLSTPTNRVSRDSPSWVVTHPVDDSDVFLPSSVPNAMGPWPCPRVLRRTGATYLTPQSPISPTLHVLLEKQSRKSDKQREQGDEQAKTPKQYLPGPIPRIQAIDFSGAKKPGCGWATEGFCTPSKSPFTTTKKTTDFLIPDTGVVPIFHPLNRPFHQLQSLDAAHAQGLSEEAFGTLFARCTTCMNFVTARSIEDHMCPGDTLRPTTQDPVTATYFLSLLDAYNDGAAGGVTQDIFEGLFNVCDRCGSHMTQRVSKYHKCYEPSGIEDVLPWDPDPPMY